MLGISCVNLKPVFRQLPQAFSVHFTHAWSAFLFCKASILVRSRPHHAKHSLRDWLSIQEALVDTIPRSPEGEGGQAVDTSAGVSKQVAEVIPTQETISPDVTREATYVAGQPSSYPGLVTANAKASGRGKLR